MDTGVLIIGIVLLALAIIPFVFRKGNKKKKTERRKKAFQDLAKAQGAQADEIELINTLLIGLDPSNKKLLVADKNQLKNTFAVLDLKKVSTCKLKVNNSPQWVGLELGGEEQSEFAFYDDNSEEWPETNFAQSKILAENWCSKIKIQLK